MTPPSGGDRQAGMDDLSTVEIDDVVRQAERRLGRRLSREGVHYSRHNGTAGLRTEAGTWVRLAWRRPNRLVVPSWTGTEQAATHVHGVPKPDWFATVTWADPDRGVVWKAEETSSAPTGAVSATAEITEDPELPEHWWSDLDRALTTLASHETDRVALDQGHLTRRIHEVYGTEVDTRVQDDSWACAHGDLGYANVTGPEPMLLDWESWGMAPIGWDAACLWSASLAVPQVEERVLAYFAEPLTTRSGTLCRLLLCANIARAVERTGVKTPLSVRMAQTAGRLLEELAHVP
ncbi:aminoglycoside phosphotransferase [Nocardiopsis alba]|uniref:aminoglycoside phosphotransferase n=1 Tax=Nocardiopsis alba TaxID=53437 RepID=UPI0036712723